VTVGGPRLDEGLVEAASRGDKMAAGAVYDALAPKVMGYFVARGAEDPEALTNDVFVAVLPRLPKLKGGEDGLRRLVFTIAHSRYVDSVRRRQNRPHLVAYDPTADPRAVEAAEVTAVAAVHGEELRTQLGRLTPDQAAVISLRIFGDLSLEETARVLGKSVGSVKQLQRRGIEALRDNLSRGGALGE
jgi:RNA polymerase sigma-70 factor (ECF subfamily)